MEKKYKIGYTTGVYDMFHIGHLNILRRAKEQCDYLIVGVSTDECVEKYKNKKPVIPFEDRQAIVSAIQYVDKVVPQKNMDKFEAWENLHYDVLFHGDDWKGSSMYNEIEAKLRAHGVEFVYFPYTKKISSTMLREQLAGKKDFETADSTINAESAAVEEEKIAKPSGVKTPKEKNSLSERLLSAWEFAGNFGRRKQ